MAELMDINTAVMLYKGFMAFALLGSIFIFLAPNAYTDINKRLMTEVGIKKRFIPWLEAEKKSVDDWILKRRGVFGVLFVAISSLLLFSVR